MDFLLYLVVNGWSWRPNESLRPGSADTQQKRCRRGKVRPGPRPKTPRRALTRRAAVTRAERQFWGCFGGLDTGRGVGEGEGGWGRGGGLQPPPTPPPIHDSYE